MDIANLEQKITSLARKHNISTSEVKKIWNYQFKKIMYIIKEDSVKEVEEKRTIVLRGLGKIEYLPNKDKMITKLNNKKKT